MKTSGINSLSVNFKRTWKTIPLALCLIGMSYPSPSWGQEKELTTNTLPRILSVSGKGKEEIPATIAQVQLGVEVQGKTAKVAQQEAAKRSNAVVSLLRSRQVEKLQTTGISLNPIYNYQNNTQRITGYSATNTVSFRINAEQAGGLLDDVVQAGATRIDRISFTASDSAIAAAQKQALKEATQDAQEQADAVLSVLNLTRKDVIGIQINGASAPVPPPIPFESSNLSQKVALDRVTAVVGGEQEIEASVTLQIRY
ncbi:SIMPL domain-containing protein [Merismopedia glauca]|uniref:SIMPL domain-containing protein n=1 Tax=Merismopedia glauca CCAP 1448/3 TaxID=1296344 RepID=A0A2T1BXY7_9CYAN|nr:SIMPL domain-containing protein [Merismopedia glauca]PSB00879.1 hypothetical protein C7B64_21195 [Merismopedia glauca CCAP 1448/3]